MLTKDCTDLIESLFAASDRAFESGDNKLGSLKLWEAAETALLIVAESRGFPCRTEDDHLDLLDHLQAETGKSEDPDIVSAYLVAGYYRDNAKYDFMESYVVKGGGIAVVRELVNELLTVATRPA